MRALSLPLTLLFAVATLAACGKGDPIQEVCELALSCDCAPPPFADVPACVTDLKQEVEDLKSTAEANGLLFSQDCLDRVLSFYTDDIQCGSDFTGSDVCQVCTPVHGDKAVGAACTDIGEYDDCDKNLQCLNKVCVDPCATLKAGEVCAKEGEFDVGRCGAGFYCDALGTKTCTAELGPGAACPNFFGCRAGLQCTPELTCQPLPKQGEPCTGTCDEDLACQDGTCQPLPAVGEPCFNGVCGPGAECDDNDMCIEGTPLLCGLNTDN